MTAAQQRIRSPEDLNMVLQKSLVAPNGRHITLPTGLFINNEFIAGSAQPITSIDPTRELEICSVQAASAEDVDKAVKAARAAFIDTSWRNMRPSDRGQLLYCLASLVEEHKETLATLEAWDNGKPYSEALDGDLGEVTGTLRYYAGYADKVSGQTITKAGYDGRKFAYTIRQPIGVCAQIIPWNYPLSMAAWKLGPALACGNTVVLKAAEQTPLSILFLATLIVKAGFPPGVVNILNGLGSETGHALAAHLDVDKIAFTGSTATAKQVMRTASVNLKNITLETGGKSPIIIFSDADVDQAAKWAHIGIMSNSGQICTATSRILVQKGEVYNKFIDRFKQTISETSVIGDPFEQMTFQGPQVSQAQYTRVLGFIESGKRQGATVALGGSAHSCRSTEGKGYFIEPTVFTDVTKSMDIYREEIFGPVAAVIAFDTEEEALALANDHTYGLGSAVFTRDVERAHRMAELLEAGMVWINSSQDGDIRVPFGGVKQSGIGRELGEAGLDAYTQIKAVHLNMGLML